METLWQDLRYAVRTLQRNPGFTVVAVLTLALGIGATTAIFSVANAVLVRPLPVAEPDRLVNVQTLGENSQVVTSFSLPEYLAYRDQTGALSGLAAHHISDITLNTGDRAEVALGMDVSANYFNVLGIRPALGRFFTASEASARDAAPVAIISHELWQHRYGENAEVLGRTIHANGQPVTIVGVAPQGFHGAMLGARPSIWLPIGLYARLHPGQDPYTWGHMTWLQLFGRLAPGVELEEAQAALSVTARQLAASQEFFPGTTPVGARVSAFSAIPGNGRGAVVGFIALLSATAGLVLMISAVNVAGMLLARTSGRRREVAIRFAIGAGRGRLIRQNLTESVLLALVGGALGVLLGSWASELLQRVRPPFAGAAFQLDLSVDATVLGFATLVAIGTGVLFGLAPALQSTQHHLTAVLKAGSPGTGRRSLLRRGMVASQIALSLLLLIMAGLFVRTLQSALTTPHGFQPQGVLAMELNVGLNGYDEERGAIFYRQLLEQVRALPAVESASLATIIPLGSGWEQTRAQVPGFVAPDESGFRVGYNAVSQDYFETLRMPLLAGRGLTEADRADQQPVMVINETFARRFWPDESPIGQRIRFSGAEVEIVGVAPDGQYRSFTEEPTLYAYVPFEQSYTHSAWLQVRTRGDAAPVMRAIRGEVSELDPNVAPVTVTTVEQVMGSSLFVQRLAASIIGFFGLLGLGLSAVGVFGVLSFTVAQRTREIGIRMALGAEQTNVLGLILKEGLKLLAIGVAVGLAAALITTRALASLLHGLSPTDPATFVGVSLLLAMVTLLACYLPARRAMRVDPVTALRAE